MIWTKYNIKYIAKYDRAFSVTEPNVFWLYTGDYAGFDTDQPTSDSGGKKIVAECLKETSNKLVFIGDGVTDLEAFPPAVRWFCSISH